MANVASPHPQIDFHRGLVSHSPSPFGFGFGPSYSSNMSPMNWPTAGGHGAFTNPVAIQQLATTISHPSRNNKRRLEDEEGQESGRGPRDEAMDRSPTPERPKRAAPKRARIVATGSDGKGDSSSKENKACDSGDQDVDVGVLLASLPPQSLLPLLNSLIQTQPALKPVILSLIPRPSLDTALQVLAQSAKKLRDAYPYSTSSPFSNATSSFPTSTSSHSGFGLGSGFNSRPTAFGSLSSGFGRPSPTPTPLPPSFGSDSTTGMRDEYIASRLRPHINDFVSACLSYLPYFSYIPAPSSSPPSSLQDQHKDKSPPTETFAFLEALTSHVLSQPALTQASLVPMLLPRLVDEWRAWVDRVDDVVNKQAGMFGGETVRGWERSLDAFAEAKDHGLEALRDVRDRWAAKVGWLVGRRVQHMMMD